MQQVLFAVGAIMLLSTSTMAQQQAVLRECAANIKAACGGEPPEGEAIRSCLNSHWADLTPPCQIVLIAVAALANECRGDIRSLCAGVEPGGGRIEACLQSHFNEFSGPCMDVMARTVGRAE